MNSRITLRIGKILEALTAPAEHGGAGREGHGGEMKGGWDWREAELVEPLRWAQLAALQGSL